MSLPHILLGLTATPTSGYELKQKFDTTLRHFWFAELSQLYPALKKLVNEGLAEVETMPSEKGPDKKLYLRTAAGREELLKWLSTGPGTAPLRHPYLAQVFFLNEHQSPEQAIKFMEDLLTRIKGTCQTLQSIEDGWKDEDDGYPDQLSDDDFFTQLTLDAGLRVNKAYIEWCETSLERLRARAAR
ncbi:PadR family transcriptional regulator [Kordiimonas sp. SCSIO 12603]|uniref:PadR family transcriptional regulator n=1 Tax=Kordiimonas sp. SCSIO 12603 TaxID=2829596 RepID=UPI0021058D94|nr:PadR family transcriptional regulator [Kordiimonas sp. SCSIO 12603]UTW58243.1 PadR family transcriptional regulator [Kordiimonas sp. SCSIO 12603]